MNSTNRVFSNGWIAIGHIIDTVRREYAAIYTVLRIDYAELSREERDVDRPLKWPFLHVTLKDFPSDTRP